MANDTVDTKVVRMEFDNKQFEKNIKQTSKSLDNLKKDLDFKGVSDGLDKVRIKLSALQIVTTTFVATLANKLVNLGIVLVKSLSVDNIASGWAKFGEKTISVATMMAQKIRIAGEEITDVGERTKVVNDLLEKLTWFADETSYSLSDMTNYAGKFIAAGTDLDKAVSAMQGIATWAALSGQNAQVASRAMQQLAQAMGRNINRQDWMSIQTANMDTEEFREKVLETAVALGELTKEGNKFVTKTGKKFEKSGFMNYFSEGWFTSDVLVETLNKYSAAVDEIYSISIKEGITASEVMDKYGDTLDEFGVKAFRASQEARTLRDVLNSVKDAVTSKWMTTFENIFGGKDEAIKLWTELSNRLYDVFAESGNFRNNVLSIWKEAKGRNDIFGEDGAFWNLYNAIDSIRLLIKKSWDIVFPISQMEDEDARAKDIARTLKNVTARIKEFTKNMAASEEVASRISKVFQILFSVLKLILFTIKAVQYTVEPLIYTLKQMTNTILGKIISMFGGMENIMSDIEKTANHLRESLWKLIDIINPRGTLDSVLAFASAIYDVIKDFKPIERILGFTDQLFKSFRENGGTQENLIKIFKGLMSIISILGKTFIQLAQILNKYVLPILDRILNISAQIIGAISGVIVSVVAAISEVIYSINNALEGNGELSGLGDAFKNLIINIGNSISKIVPILQSLLHIMGSLIDLILVIPKLLDSISIRLTGRGIVDNLKNFFDSIANAITSFVEKIQNASFGEGSSSVIDGVFNGIQKFLDGLIEMVKGLIAVANILIGLLGQAFKVIGIALQKIADVFVKLFSGRFKDLSKSQKTGLIMVATLAGIVAISILMYNVFYRLIEAVDPLGSIAESLVDSLDRVRLIVLAKSIDMFANAFLKFAVALAILDNVKSATIKSIALIVTIIGLLAALIYILKDTKEVADDLKKTTKKTDISLKQTVSEIAKSTATYRSIAKILKAIGIVLIEIAVAAMILDKLDPAKNSFGKIMGLLAAVLVGVIAMMEIINYYGKQANRSAKSTIQTISGLRDIKTALSGIMGIMITLIIAMKIMDGINASSYDRTMFMFGIVSGAILALILAIGSFSVLFEKYGGSAADKAKKATANAKKLSSAFKGLSLALITIAAVVISISIALAITTKSLTKMSESTGGGSATSSGFNANLLTPVISIISILTVIAAAMAILPKVMKGTNKSQINKISQLLGFFTGSLIAIANSLAIVSKIPVDQLRNSALVLGGLLLAISILMLGFSHLKFGNKAMEVAAAISIIATSLVLFAYAMRAMSGIDYNSTGKGLLMIGASLVVLAGLAWLFDKLVPSIFRLGVAFLTVSSAILIFVTSLALISKLVDHLSTSGEKFKGFLMNLAEGLMSMLKVILTGLTSLIPQLLVILINGLGKVLEAIINLINTYVGPLAITIVNAIIEILSVIAANIDTIIGYVNQILLSLVLGSLDFIAMQIGPITDKLVEIVHNLVEALVNNLPKLAQDIVKLLITITQIVADILPKLLKILIPSLIEGILDVIGAVFEALGAKLSDDTKALLKKAFMQALATIMEVLSVILDIILNVLQNLDLTSILEIIKIVLNAIGRILVALMPVINEIIDAILLILNAIDWEQLLGFIAKVLGIIADIIEWIAPILANIIAPIIKIIVSLLTAFLKIIEPILKLIMNILEPILELVSALLESIAALLSGDYSKISEVWSKVGESFAKLGETFKRWFENIGEVLGRAFEAIGNWFKKVGETIWNGLKTATTAVGNWFKQLGENIKSGLKTAAIAVGNWFKQLGENIKSGFKKAFEAIDNWFKDLWKKFKEWGHNLVQGLVDGIKEWWNNVKNGFKKWCNDIANGFKKFFGIHSPSKVFAEYGKYMVMGLTQGLEDETKKERSKLSNVAKTTMKILEDALNANNGYDYVMKIGMDISNVEKETGKVQDLMNSIGTNRNISAYGYNANKVSASIAASERANSKVDKTKETSMDNSVHTTTNNNTFNIKSTDPKETAEEIDKLLQKNAIKAKLAKGGI